MDTCQHQMVSGPRRGKLCGKPTSAYSRCKKHQITTITTLDTATPKSHDGTSFSSRVVELYSAPTKVGTSVIYGQQCCYLFTKGEKNKLFCGNSVSTGNIYCNSCSGKKSTLQCILSGCQESSSNTNLYCNIHAASEPILGTVLTSEQFNTELIPEGLSKRRSAIPQAVRELVWRKYINNSLDGECYCCDKSISFTSFHAGHVIPDTEGGPATLENLRPVCSSCNLSMGTMWMDAYVRKYGLKGAAAIEWPTYTSNHNPFSPMPTPTIPTTTSAVPSPLFPTIVAPTPAVYQYAIPTSTPISTRKDVPSSNTAIKSTNNRPVTKPRSAKKSIVVGPDNVGAKVNTTSVPTSSVPFVPHIPPASAPTSLSSTVGGAVRKIAPIIGVNEDILDQLLEDFEQINLAVAVPKQTSRSSKRK